MLTVYIQQSFKTWYVLNNESFSSRMTYRYLLGIVLNMFSNDLEDSINSKLKKYRNHTSPEKKQYQ